ncbi:MAG: hypothetical protein IPN76_16020 [Saprospiraceae bacterium]|nr:hypothetical protein [Saprospiraceae bacterium]
MQSNYLRGFGIYGSGWRQCWGEVAAMKEVEQGFGSGFKEAIARPENGKWAAVKLFQKNLIRATKVLSHPTLLFGGLSLLLLLIEWEIYRLIRFAIRQL